MKAKIPTDLKTRQGKRKLRVVAKPRKNELWYAAAVLQIGITKKDPARQR